MAVVKDYFSPEGCHIIVHDDCYKDKTLEEVRAIVDRVSEIVLRAEYQKYIENRK